MIYTPPFTITTEIFQLAQKISKELGILAGQKNTAIPFQLRRSQQIKTIAASLAIEGNALTVEQITAILEGKRVLGPSTDILETTNALLVYADLKKINPLHTEDFLKVHEILMKDLISSNGKWRSENVGIIGSGKVNHIAPPHERVPFLMKDLFQFLNEADLSWLLKACIFHYEMEFIHPFGDGNGRMGRLWQQLLLMQEDPIFEWIPIEVLIKEHQKEYYEVLGKSDAEGESSVFIAFSLNIIYRSLLLYSKNIPLMSKDYSSRLDYAKRFLEGDWFSRKDYLEIHKDISPATASRDLISGFQQGTLISKGTKNQVRYKFV